MRNVLLALFVLLSLVAIQPQSVEAAGCRSAVSGYESGQYVIVVGKFWCTGMTGTGKVCAGGVCSSSVSIPSNGTSASANIAWKMPFYCISSSNVSMKTYISGALSRSFNFYYC